MIREQRKRLRKFGCLATVSGVLVPFVLIPLLFLGVTTTSDEDDCLLVPSTQSVATVSSAYASVADFVQQHEEAYLLSWNIGGFLPSASITQTMIENGFNFTNPDGTSLWKAHNMGGVKTSHRSDFTETIKLYGEDSVDLTGTKEGTNVGDNTGGAYTWFKDYDSGIVGKAEFMKNQSLYRGAINNTDGVSTLEAIAAGGWASDAVDYRNKLVNEYANLGEKFKWLDKKAIEKYGAAPVSASSLSSMQSNDNTSVATSTGNNTRNKCGGSRSGGSTSNLGAGDFGALFDVPFTVSQSYGNSWAIYASGSHSGVDLIPVVGAAEIKIYAISDGEVVKSGDGYGNSLQHKTPDGRYAHYAHLRHTPLFKVGDKVKKGDQIGVMGTTGMSFGEHLHFEILASPPYGQKFDPSYVVIESGALTPGMVIEPRKVN